MGISMGVCAYLYDDSHNGFREMSFIDVNVKCFTPALMKQTEDPRQTLHVAPTNQYPGLLVAIPWNVVPPNITKSIKITGWLHSSLIIGGRLVSSAPEELVQFLNEMIILQPTSVDQRLLYIW